MPHPRFLKWREEQRKAAQPAPPPPEPQVSPLMQAAPVYRQAAQQVQPPAQAKPVETVAKQPPAAPPPATGKQGGYGQAVAKPNDWTNRGEPTASRAQLTGNQQPTARQKLWGKAGAAVTNGQAAGPATSVPSQGQPLMKMDG